MNKIRIVLAEDSFETTNYLTDIISARDDMELISTVNTGYEAILDGAIMKPDIILISDNLDSPMGGIIISKTILSRLPDLKIIILTDKERRSLIDAAFKAGITDYIYKKSSPDTIITTILDVNKLDHPRQQDISEKYYMRTRPAKKNRDSLMYTLTVVSQLTPKEYEIATLIIDGKSQEDIARLRNTSIDEINECVNRILYKFEKNSTSELRKLFKSLNISDFINHFI